MGFISKAIYKNAQRKLLLTAGGVACDVIDKSIKASRNATIKIPNDSGYYIGKKYIKVLDELYDRGFTEIVAIPKYKKNK